GRTEDMPPSEGSICDAGPPVSAGDDDVLGAANGSTQVGVERRRFYHRGRLRQRIPLRRATGPGNANPRPELECRLYRLLQQNTVPIVATGLCGPASSISGLFFSLQVSNRLSQCKPRSRCAL